MSETKIKRRYFEAFGDLKIENNHLRKITFIFKLDEKGWNC